MSRHVMSLLLQMFSKESQEFNKTSLLVLRSRSILRDFLVKDMHADIVKMDESLNFKGLLRYVTQVRVSFYV